MFVCLIVGSVTNVTNKRFKGKGETISTESESPPRPEFLDLSRILDKWQNRPENVQKFWTLLVGRNNIVCLFIWIDLRFPRVIILRFQLNHVQCGSPHELIMIN